MDDNQFDSLSKKAKKLLSNLDSISWSPGLSAGSYELIASCNFRSGNDALAAVACELVIDCQPITLRGLFYQIVSHAPQLLPSTDKVHYNRCKGLVKSLRKHGLIPYQYIVDSLRSTVKPSSWSGLEDFADTVREVYRKDFWSHLDHYVHIICEKDAIAGTLAKVTREYDVPLSPIRGYCSESFAYEIGSQWAEIDKPIHAYYLGDFDPSGFDIERDVKTKIAEHSGCKFTWERLAVRPDDFELHNLIPLQPKKSDRRYQKFVDKYGYSCAEVDAISPVELRSRVKKAITQWIPADQWARLQRVEELERETFNQALVHIAGGDA